MRSGVGPEIPASGARGGAAANGERSESPADHGPCSGSLEPHFLDDWPELLDLLAQDRVVFRGQRADRLGGNVGETLHDIRVLHRRGCLALQLHDDLVRRLRRHANRPFQPSAASSRKPSSRTVGTSGNSGMRFDALVASARSLPARMSASEEKSWSPPTFPPWSSSRLSGAAPFNGTCVMSTFASRFERLADHVHERAGAGRAVRLLLQALVFLQERSELLQVLGRHGVLRYVADLLTMACGDRW